MPLLEGVIAGILAHGAVETASKGRETVTKIGRDNRFSNELDPIATEFNDVLAERIETVAQDIESFELQSIALHWEVIAEEIDAYEVVFESEEEAVDWLFNEIVSIEDIDINPEAEAELRSLLAEEFASALEDFRERVEGTDLEDRFQEDMGIEIHRRIDKIVTRLERLANQERYRLYDFPAERETVLDELLHGNPVTFVDREEVPDTPTPGRYFVIGPSGSGKSSIIAERVRRHPEDAIAHVLIPDERMLDPSDAKAIAQESFDGDLLLVWEDVHRINEARENAVLERTLRELDRALDDAGHELYTLLEARSGRIDDIPGTLPADFEDPKSLWNTYEPLRVSNLDERSIHEIADAMAAELEIELEQSVHEALVNRTVGSKSAPIYVRTALVTADERLTIEDIDALADNALDIWRSQYETLRVEAQAEWRVLASAKVLDDCNLPLFSKLVRAVYSDLFGGSEGGFRAAIQSLTERQWLTVVGKDLVATATVYEIHDIQLEPVQANANDHIESISTLLLEDIEWTVPKSARAVVHFISGFSFYNWEAYTKSKKQWRAVLEIDPDNAITHNNYATLLAQQFDGPEKAVGHYEQAIEIDPSYAEAHNNYANLLVRQFGDPEEAASHYETAIENDSDKAEYHLNYANLLKNELCRPEVADTHFDQAIEINPEIPEAHYNYADLLAEQLDRCEAAAEHYEQAIEIEPEYAEAHNNYGLLLRYQLGQFEAAAKHFEQAIDIDSEYAEAHNNYGLLLAEEYNRTETAAKHYKRVIEIDPDIADAHYNYANILFEELDRIEAAAEHYQRAINLNSEIADFHCNYGNLFFEELDRPEAAAEHYERAIDINPEHAEAHNNYAHLLKNKRENLEKAADHLEIAIDTGLDSDEQHSLRRALQGIPAFVSLCEEVGRQEAAIKSCEQALKRIPTASIHDGDRFEHQIQVMYAKITARPASERVPELYQFGLNALCSRAFGPSADLLNEAWGLRDELEDEGKNMAVAAGVWCIGIPDFNIDKEAVKSSEENFEDSSSVVVNALMTAFFTDEDPPTPSQLRQSYSITDSVLELELAAYEALFGINHRLLF